MGASAGSHDFEDLLRQLLDSPVGLAAAVGVLAVVILALLRLASGPSKPKTFLDPQQVR